VSNLIVGTNVVSMDEMCFSLKDWDEMAPDSRGVHRYRVIKVPRGEKLVEFRQDLGLASKFTGPAFVVPGAIPDLDTGRIEWVHTVGECVDIANYIADPSRQTQEPPQPFDYVSAYHDNLDQKKLRRRKRSMVGPQVRVQRD
jgi:hypothetical protein